MALAPYTPAQKTLLQSLILIQTSSRSTRIPPPPASNARTYASSSGFTGFYKKLVKKSLESSKWEFNELDPNATINEAAPYVATARKLKETLAASPNSNTLDFAQIKALLIQLLTEIPAFSGIPDERLSSPFIKNQKLIENSFSVLLAADPSTKLPINLTSQDIELLYTLMVSKTGNIFSSLGKSPIIPNLFSLLHITRNQLESNKDLDLYLLYFKFLSAHKKETEAKKFLDWLIPIYHPERNQDLFNQFLYAVSQPFILKSCIPHLFSLSTTTTPSTEAILFALRQLSLLDSSVSLKFTKQLFKSYPELYSNAQVVSLVLKTLNKNIRQASEIKAFISKFLAHHSKDENSLASIDEEIKDPVERLEFHKSLALTLIKYNDSSVQTQKYLETDVGIPDIELYKTLAATEGLSAESIRTIFKDATAKGLEINNDIMHNALDILIIHKFNVAENFDALHDFFTTELNFESDIGTFESLILGSLNNSQKRQGTEAAIILFEKSIENGIQWNIGTEDQLETLDKLILALCQTMPDDVFKVFKSYQKVRMFVSSVGYQAQVALLKLFLSYNYVGDCERFLEDELGKETRDIAWDAEPELYQTLLEYALKSDNYKDAWLIYGLSEKYYDAPYASYEAVLRRFCALERPDAALLIFKNLRNKAKVSGSEPPSAEMYRLLFHEFGAVGYEDGIRELYIFLKMDISVDPSVPLLNSALNAFTELEDFSQAVELWSQIQQFPGGPDSESYTTVLKLCTHASIQDVEHMWETLQADNRITPSEENYRQYIVANCYHGFYARALEIARNMPMPPAKETIAGLYNWTMLQARKDDVREWAREAFPRKWAALETEDGALKTYLLDEENKNNDSEANLRRQAIRDMLEEKEREQIEREGRIVREALAAPKAA